MIDAVHALVVVLALTSCTREADRPTPPTPTPTPTPTPPPTPDAAAPARWIHKTWMGPAISALGPEITLCSDGTYRTTTTYALAEDKTKPWRTRGGRACCQPAERGTYELERDAAGAITRVKFTPTWSHDGTVPAPREEAISNDILHGFHANGSPRYCP